MEAAILAERDESYTAKTIAEQKLAWKSRKHDSKWNRQGRGAFAYSQGGDRGGSPLGGQNCSGQMPDLGSGKARTNERPRPASRCDRNSPSCTRTRSRARDKKCERRCSKNSAISASRNSNQRAIRAPSGRMSFRRSSSSGRAVSPASSRRCTRRDSAGSPRRRSAGPSATAERAEDSGNTKCRANGWIAISATCRSGSQEVPRDCGTLEQTREQDGAGTGTEEADPATAAASKHSALSTRHSALRQRVSLPDDLDPADRKLGELLRRSTSSIAKQLHATKPATTANAGRCYSGGCLTPTAPIDQATSPG